MFVFLQDLKDLDGCCFSTFNVMYEKCNLILYQASGGGRCVSDGVSFSPHYKSINRKNDSDTTYRVLL